MIDPATGKPMIVAAMDPRIPPGGSVAADGRILDANGQEVKGADGKPLVIEHIAAAAALDAALASGTAGEEDGKKKKKKRSKKYSGEDGELLADDGELGEGCRCCTRNASE